MSQCLSASAASQVLSSPHFCWPKWPAFHDMILRLQTCFPALLEAVPRAEELFGCAVNSFRLRGGQFPVLRRGRGVRT